MFEILDFDANFKAYLEKWIELNKGKFKTLEQMEDAVPQVYLRWLNSPAAFLEGETPGAYFQKYSSAPELVKWLRLYDEKGVSAPEMLLDRITDLGSESLKPLLFTAGNEKYPPSLRMTALNLIKELDAGKEPMALCFKLIDAREENDELADVAAELMQSSAEGLLDEIIARLPGASPEARATYLDILADHSGDERVFDELLSAFETDRQRCALYASLLGKLGDERALDALNRALDREEINYLDYIEIRDAIEALGGECAHERDFNGDPYYETLKGE